MYARSTPLALALAILLCFSACSSQEPLTLEEYAATVSDVSSEYDECSERVRQEVSDEYDAESGLSTQEDFAYFMDLVTGWQTCFREGTEALEGVEPPAQLTEAHEELVSARDDYFTEWRSFTRELESFDEIEAMFGAVEGTASASALQTANNAVCRIGEILDTEGVTHDVTCAEDETETTEPEGKPEVVLILADYTTETSSGVCAGALELSQVTEGSILQFYDGTGELIAEIALPTPHETDAGCVFELGDPLNVSLDEYANFTIIPESSGGSGSSTGFKGNQLIVTYSG